MKKLLLFCLALAAMLAVTPTKADVTLLLGARTPSVVVGTKHPHNYQYYPPAKHHHDYRPPVKHPHQYHPPTRHRHAAPPVYYYPEKVYKHTHKHYRDPYYRPYKQVRPSMHRHHLRHGTRPVPPPHAWAHGHWRR